MSLTVLYVLLHKLSTPPRKPDQPFGGMPLQFGERASEKKVLATEADPPFSDHRDEAAQFTAEIAAEVFFSS